MRSIALQVTTTTTLLLACSATRLLALAPSQNTNHDIDSLALERRDPLLYNPPGYDSNDRAGNPHESVGDSSGSSVPFRPSLTQLAHASAIDPVQPATTTDCQQPLATFFITHAAFISCPSCSTGGGGGGGGGGGADGAGQEDSNTSANSSAKAPMSQSSQQTSALHSPANMMENLTVTIKNPSTTTSFGAGNAATDIHCHVDWDTSAAAANKFPIAKQMECDHDEQNQLNAVVEKQAKGAAAGFYLFVWNNNQMETMAAWMVRNLTATSNGGQGWTNGSDSMYQRWYFDGIALLNQMPDMVLSEFLAGGWTPPGASSPGGP